MKSNEERQEDIRSLLDTPVWPEGLEARQCYSREDDAGLGGVTVTVGEDGDAYLAVTAGGHRTGVRFCTIRGGGRSGRVRAALLILAQAIRLDNDRSQRLAANSWAEQGNYVCDYETHTALLGPVSSKAAVDFIISQGDLKVQARFCNMSRYALAKEGRYPRTKAGDEALRKDVENAKVGGGEVSG